MFSTETCFPNQTRAQRSRRRPLSLIFLAVLTTGTLTLAGCGGGGGGGSRAPAPTPTPPPPPEPTGSIAVTVIDELDGPVGDANITVTADGTTLNGLTGTDGIAVIDDVPTGTATVAVTAPQFFVAGVQDDVTVEENLEASFLATLTRITEPAGGVRIAQLPASEPLASTDGQTVTIQVELVVVNDDPAAPSALATLGAADFTLVDCVDTRPSRVDCLRDGPSDIGYTVISAGAEEFGMIDPMEPPVNYGATLTIDQTGSVAASDPSDARLFGHKTFVNQLGAGNFASISAFAQEGNGSDPALIPTEPVSRLSDFVQGGGDNTVLFSDIDELAAQEGGGTPLFLALDAELDFTAANAPAGLGRLAVVQFTDGDDTFCDPPNTDPCGIEVSTQKSTDLNVDIFTVGLGSDLAVDTLQQLAIGGNGLFMFAETPPQLFPIYRALGEIIAGSVQSYTMQWTITADEANAYQPGRTIYGVVEVDTGENTLNLPIRVFL